MAGSDEAYSLAFTHSTIATTNLDKADIVTYETAGNKVITPGLLMEIPVTYSDNLGLPYKTAGFEVERTHVYSRPDLAGDYETIVPLILPTDFRLPSCANTLTDQDFAIPNLSATPDAPTTYPEFGTILSRVLPTPEVFIEDFLKNGFALSQAKIGSIADKMVMFKQKLEAREQYNALNLVGKGTLILDAMLTAEHGDRGETYWVGCPTHVDQLQAAVAGMVEMKERGEPPEDLPRVALAIGTVVAAQERVAKHVHANRKLTFTKEENAAILRLARDARNETEQLSGLDWETLIRYATTERLQRWITLTRREQQDRGTFITEPAPIITHAGQEPKEGHQTLTQQERARLDDLLAQGGTRSMGLQDTAALIRASGEEITGVKTAYLDLSTTHTAPTIVGHIARGMRTLCGENSLRQIPNLLVLKVVTLKLDTVNWSLAHFGDVRSRDRAINTASETIELISGRMRMTKPPRHLWAAIKSRTAFGSAVKGFINVIYRFSHPTVWSTSEVNDVLIQLDTLHNDFGGHVNWTMAERMMIARMAEHCEDTRNEIIKGTYAPQEFNLFRDTSAELWETLKTHASEDCRRANLAIAGAGLTMSETNATLRNNEPEFTVVSHSGDKVAPALLNRQQGKREKQARHQEALHRPGPMHIMEDPPLPPPNPDPFEQRKRLKRGPDPPNMTCIRCGVRGHTAHRCQAPWCSIPSAGAWTMRMKLKAIYIRAAAKIYHIHFEERSEADSEKISDALRRYNCKVGSGVKQEQPPRGF